MENKKYFYYMYQITNIINGKIYIGVHKTDNLDDNYFGSGKILNKAIAIYGKENFEKIILQFFESMEDAFNAESITVDTKFINREDTYNIRIGGCGSLGGKRHWAWGKHPSEETREKFRKRYKSEETKEKMRQAVLGKKHSTETREKMRRASLKRLMENNHPMLGRHPSEETIEKLRIAKGGKNNPLFGKHHSEETRAKLRLARIGRTPMYGKNHTEETKRKIGEGNKGKKRTEEWRQNKSIVTKLWWQRKKELQNQTEIA